MKDGIQFLPLKEDKNRIVFLYFGATSDLIGVERGSRVDQTKVEGIFFKIKDSLSSLDLLSDIVRRLCILKMA